MSKVLYLDRLRGSWNSSDIGPLRVPLQCSFRAGAFGANLKLSAQGPTPVALSGKRRSAMPLRMSTPSSWLSRSGGEGFHLTAPKQVEKDSVDLPGLEDGSGAQLSLPTPLSSLALGQAVKRVILQRRNWQKERVALATEETKAAILGPPSETAPKRQTRHTHIPIFLLVR